MTEEAKHLLDLKVTELRAELDKRGLDKSGNKPALIFRLTEAIQEEGHDPDTYMFSKNDQISSHGNQEEENGSGIVENQDHDQGHEENAVLLKEENPVVASQSSLVAKHVQQDSLIVHVDDDLDEDLDMDASTTTAPASCSAKKSSPKKKETKRKDSKDETKSSENKDAIPEGAPKSSNASSGEGTKGPNKDETDRNVWVSGLSKDDRASDLQGIFKKYGKVVGAKIITNTKMAGGAYFGLITMETSGEADESIKQLNKTKLNGKTITVEKNRPSESSSGKKDDKSRDKDRKSRDGKKGNRDRRPSPGRRSPRRNRSPIRNRLGGRPGNRPPFLGKPGGPVGKVFIPNRDRIMNPQELRRIEAERLARRRERITRENEDRRRTDSDRRGRDVMERVEREKEKLRIERERLEKEKAELLRLERERARAERERIEREKEELKRRIQSEQELRRPIAMAGVGLSSAPIGPGISSMKRAYESAGDSYWDDASRKRQMAMSDQSDSMALGRVGSYDQPMGGLSLDSARYDTFVNRSVAPERYSGFSSASGATDSRSRDNGRHGTDRDDRGRGGMQSNSFYRNDSRDNRGRGSGRGGDDRRDSRPTIPSSVMMSSVSAVGGNGMYSGNSAPLGPSSLMSHGSLSSGSMSAPMDRSYGHSSIRRF